MGRQIRGGKADEKNLLLAQSRTDLRLDSQERIPIFFHSPKLFKMDFSTCATCSPSEVTSVSEATKSTVSTRRMESKCDQAATARQEPTVRTSTKPPHHRVFVGGVAYQVCN